METAEFKKIVDEIVISNGMQKRGSYYYLESKEIMVVLVKRIIKQLLIKIAKGMTSEISAHLFKKLNLYERFQNSQRNFMIHFNIHINDFLYYE